MTDIGDLKLKKVRLHRKPYSGKNGVYYNITSCDAPITFKVGSMPILTTRGIYGEFRVPDKTYRMGIMTESPTCKEVQATGILKGNLTQDASIDLYNDHDKMVYMSIKKFGAKLRRKLVTALYKELVDGKNPIHNYFIKDVRVKNAMCDDDKKTLKTLIGEHVRLIFMYDGPDSTNIRYLRFRVMESTKNIYERSEIDTAKLAYKTFAFSPTLTIDNILVPNIPSPYIKINVHMSIVQQDVFNYELYERNAM